MKPIAILNINGNDHSILKVKEGYVVIDEITNEERNHFQGWLVFQNELKQSVIVQSNQNNLINPVVGKDKKIITSTFPLEGVKRFEMVDEAEQYALSIIPHTDEGNVEDDIDSAKRRLIVHGYKTAQSKGLFNEEQMYLLAAYVTDFIAGRKGDFMITTPKDVADKFIQTLLPRYEVEMEEYRHNSCVNKCASYPSDCLCKMEGIKPLTYEKDGVTYLKFKKH